MSNQEAVDIAKKTKDPQRAAKKLAAEALNRDSKDDISCIVVRLKGWTKNEHDRIHIRDCVWYESSSMGGNMNHGKSSVSL